MKHIYLPSGLRYHAYISIDPFTKQALIHLSRNASSQSAKEAISRTITTFGKQVTILNDNGSENMGKTYDYLKSNHVKQLFARPYRPKDKPHVENLIGKYQQECLDQNRQALSLKELTQITNRWLNDYHFFRPHQALNYQTPAEFCATMGLTIRLA
jgi:putative transposase